jgi:hypothetical protein
LPPEIPPGPWAWYQLGGVDYLCCNYGRRDVVLGPECRTVHGRRAGNVPAYHATRDSSGRLVRLETDGLLGRSFAHLPDLLSALSEIASIPFVAGDHEAMVRGLARARIIAERALRQCGGERMVPRAYYAAPFDKQEEAKSDADGGPR